MLLRTLLLSREVRMLPTCIARVSEVERGERREREERREESAGCRAQGALERSENAAHLHRTVCCSQVSRERRGQRREERGEVRAQNAVCKYSHSKYGALLSSEQSGERERERERERREERGERRVQGSGCRVYGADAGRRLQGVAHRVIELRQRIGEGAAPRAVGAPRRAELRHVHVE